MTAFSSAATNLVAGDTNGKYDVFVHDLKTGATVRVSVDSAGNEADGDSTLPSLSANGRFVAFSSLADNLVSGDTNGTRDVFVHDRDPDGNGIFDEGNGVTVRVSLDSNGIEGDGDSETGSNHDLSDDGRRVTFRSDADNLVPGDGNGVTDVFVRDLTTAMTTRVSVDSSGVEANAASTIPSISGDGSTVAFQSDATNLVAGDTNGQSDVFTHVLTTGATTRVSLDSTGKQFLSTSHGPTALSSDGVVVAFLHLGADSESDVVVYSASTGSTEQITQSWLSYSGDWNWDSYYWGSVQAAPSISADGSKVNYVFDVGSCDSWAYGPWVGSATAYMTAFDRSTQIASSLVGDSTSDSTYGDWIYGSKPLLNDPAISASGSIVAFEGENDDLITGDNNSAPDVFSFDVRVAAWSNYGAGFPGTLGVPSFTAQQNPVLGKTTTLLVANSSPIPTVGVLFVGFEPTDIPSSWGGDLLVAPTLVAPMTFWYGGDWFSTVFPDDETLNGLTLDLQALEVDPGAAKGVSFTPGLSLVLGY